MAPNNGCPERAAVPWQTPSATTRSRSSPTPPARSPMPWPRHHDHAAGREAEQRQPRHPDRDHQHPHGLHDGDAAAHVGIEFRRQRHHSSGPWLRGSRRAAPRAGPAAVSKPQIAGRGHHHGQRRYGRERHVARRPGRDPGQGFGAYVTTGPSSMPDQHHQQTRASHNGTRMWPPRQRRGRDRQHGAGDEPCRHADEEGADAARQPR